MTSAPGRPMSLQQWGMLVSLSFLWGGSFFFTEVAVRELPPLVIVAARVGLAALILNVVARAMGLSLPTAPRLWAAFLAMGVLNNVIPFTLIVWGQTHIASGLASILNATTPLFTVLIAHVATAEEKMTPNRLAGVVLGFVGVVVMIGPGALHALGANLWAQVGCLAAAASYAIAAVFGRRFGSSGVNPLLTATGQVTASAVILMPIAAVFDRPLLLPWPSPSVVSAVVGLAVLSTALAYAIYFRILATSGATNLLLVTFLIPVSAVLLGALVLSESVEGLQLAGMALIGLGLAAIDGRLLCVPVAAGMAVDGPPGRRYKPAGVRPLRPGRDDRQGAGRFGHCSHYPGTRNHGEYSLGQEGRPPGGPPHRDQQDAPQPHPDLRAPGGASDCNRR